MNDAVPLPCPLLSLGLTVMLTPVAGFEVFTVNVYVVGGGGVVVELPLPPPPHAARNQLMLTASQSAAFCRKFFIAIFPSDLFRPQRSVLRA